MPSSPTWAKPFTTSCSRRIATTGEGELDLQPWLAVDEPDLLASDLCRGWIDALQELGLTHLSERLDDLTAGSPPMPSDLVLFNVKPRSPPKK